MTGLNSEAEQHALSAQDLRAFPINLLDIKRKVSDILSTFGKNGIFEEYTPHDITHIDDMLATSKWLIPNETKEKLTPAEWLLIVLSVYFHDMGLVVTKKEFESRGSSGFQQFCETRLFAGPEGADYRAKVDLLPEVERDRFLYQEFVRSNHGRRIRAWIEGTHNPELGFATAQLAEVDALLSKLDGDFRRDLGIVCESHALDDLADTKRYRLSHPYGNSDDETANLQYCSALLRTIDLLQVTNRRAPSTLFRLINPSDPISQIEWAKQNAVKRIRPKDVVGEDGAVLRDVQSDTIEVFANFKDAGGFFGLTSYLRYAKDQLGATFEVIEKSKSATRAHYMFPWKHIDDDKIEVDGFIKEPFGFEIDQEKILDLLTGHTLYNDSNVVVRELTQNAIDAVRLQFVSGDSSRDGLVRIEWSSSLSELTISDNGTGMTQSIIENHLLKVGSSRYQDQKFKEEFPAFSPISRFGIGVLSAFMVADEVEIVTVSPAEDQARQISLRSVHGKYLIRLLDKNADERAVRVGPHGTSFRLRFRASAKRLNVLETVRQWIMFPRCRVEVVVDGEAPVMVGYESPKAALSDYLGNSAHARRLGGGKWVVEERTVGGLTLAFALRYNDHYRDWSLIAAPEPERRLDERRPPIGTAVEGVAVEFETPGFAGTPILAVANAVGHDAPRTNVARSSLEATDEKERSAERVYRILMEWIASEASRQHATENYSLTWATEQIPYIVGPITGSGRGRPTYHAAHGRAMDDLPMFLVEAGNGRSAKSLNELASTGVLWTVESLLQRSVEEFIREAKAEVTAHQLLQVSQGTAPSLPTDAIVANAFKADLLSSSIYSKFEVEEVRGKVPDRRLDLKWVKRTGRWRSRSELIEIIYRSGTSASYQLVSVLNSGNTRLGYTDVNVPLGSVVVDGLDEYVAFESGRHMYIIPGTPIADLFSDIFQDIKSMDDVSAAKYLLMMDALASSTNSVISEAAIERFYKHVDSQVAGRLVVGREELQLAVAKTDRKRGVFDPLAWTQREIK